MSTSELRLAHATAQNELAELQKQLADTKAKVNEKQKLCNELKRKLRQSERAPKSNPENE